MQLWSIDTLNTDRHLPASLNDVFSGELRIVEDTGAAERLRGRVRAELETIRVYDHVGGVSVGCAIRPELREIDCAAYPQKSFHRTHTPTLPGTFMVNRSCNLNTHLSAPQLETPDLAVLAVPVRTR